MILARLADWTRDGQALPAQPDAIYHEVHPLLFATPAGCARCTQGMSLISAFDAEQGGAGSFHWHCLFEVDGDSGTP